MASPQKTDIKIEDLCRTCLSKDNELISIYDILIGTLPLEIIVSSVTGIKVNVIFVFTKPKFKRKSS